MQPPQIGPSPFYFRKALTPPKLTKAVPNDKATDDDMRRLFEEMRWMVTREMNRQANLLDDDDAFHDLQVHINEAGIARTPKRLLDVLRDSDLLNSISNMVLTTLYALDEQGYGHKSLPDAEPPHRFACLMARPPLAVAEAIREWQRQNIDPDHLGPGGMETDSHVTCFLPGQELQGQVSTASKVRYSGKAIKVRTARGVTLSVTENHPVLTVMGFVPAGDLKEGDQLLHYVGKDKLPAVSDDEQHAPALVEDVFESLSNGGGRRLALGEEVSVLDFHGDAEFFKSDVHVVGTDSRLRRNYIPQGSQFLSQNKLSRRRLRGLLRLPARSDVALSLKRWRNTPTCRIGIGEVGDSFGGSHTGVSLLSTVGVFGANVGSTVGCSCRLAVVPHLNSRLDQPVINGARGQVELPRELSGGQARLVALDQLLQDRVGHSQSAPSLRGGETRRFGAASDVDVPFLKTPLDGVRTDVVLARQLRDRFPGDVVTDQVVDVTVFHYDGPVYDFESPLGYIVVNRTFTSNCKFGFTNDDIETVDAIVRIMESEGPIPVTLKGFGVFSPNDDGDVLHVECESPRLRALNERLSKEFPCVDTHPDYKPHLTVAYIKPEFIDLYKDVPAPFLNQDVVFDTAVWSDRSRNHRVIVLGLRGQQPKPLDGLAKGMNYQDAERHLRSKERLFAELASDGQTDILRDAVTEALEEVGYEPTLRSTTANEFVYTLMNRMYVNGGGMNEALSQVSRLVAAVVANVRTQQGLRQQGDKDLSWLNASAGGALVKPPKQPKRLVKSIDVDLVIEMLRDSHTGHGVVLDYLKENTVGVESYLHALVMDMGRLVQEGNLEAVRSRLNWLQAANGIKTLSTLTKSLPDQRMVAEFIRQGDLGPLADYLQDLGYDTDERRVRDAVEDVQQDLQEWEHTRADRIRDGDVITWPGNGWNNDTVLDTRIIPGTVGTVEITIASGPFQTTGNTDIRRLVRPPLNDVARYLIMHANSQWKTKSLPPTFRDRKSLVPPTLVDGKS